MPGVNKVLYNLDQRGETTPEERTTARRNIDAISADDVAVLFDDHYKVKQSPINMTFASNAVLRRLYQNANGEIGAECNYIYNATSDAAGLMSPYDKTKLDGIAYGAEMNVQSDWNVNDESSDAFIRNRPNLAVFVTHDELGARLDTKQDKLTAGNNIIIDANNVISATADPQVQADWAQADSDAVDFIKHKPQNLVQDQDYVHTDNNFTDADKTKLADIEAGAEVNVKPDWDAVAGSDAEILNKPQNLVQDADYHHTDNNYTTAEKNKLAGIEACAEVNVQSDWSENDSSEDSYIRNRPDLSVYATKSEVATDLAGKQDTLTAGSNITITNNVISATAEPQQQADWAQTDSSAVDYVKHKPDLSVYATKSEVASDLAGKQDTLTAGSNITITNNVISATAEPQQNADWNATSGVTEILNKPQNLVQDADYVHTDNNFTDADKTKLAGIEADAEANVQADWTEADSAADSFIKHKPKLATVATSGSYNDLTDKPSIPAAQVNSDWNAVSGVAQILNKPNLAAVATSGDYDDLTNKPAMPYTPPIKPLVAGTGIEITEQANSVTIASSVDVPCLTWTQSNQGATIVTDADALDIHQDTHQVTMHYNTNSTVNLGFVVPPVAAAPPSDKILKMASGNTVPTWSDAPTEIPSMVGNDGKVLGAVNNGGTMQAQWINAPEGHTIGFITVS